MILQLAVTQEDLYGWAKSLIDMPPGRIHFALDQFGILDTIADPINQPKLGVIYLFTIRYGNGIFKISGVTSVNRLLADGFIRAFEKYGKTASILEH